MQAAHLTPTVLNQQYWLQDLTWSTIAWVTDQAYSWFSSLGSSDSVQLRNLALLVGNFYLKRKDWSLQELMRIPGKARRVKQCLKSHLLHFRSSAADRELPPRPRGQKIAEQREQYKEAGEVDEGTTLTRSVSSGNEGFLRDEVG